MTDREWIERTIAHEETERVPYNFDFTPSVERAVKAHYGVADLEETLALPIRITCCNSIKPLYADPTQYGETVTDEFGVVWRTNPFDRGSVLVPCLEEADLSGYTFPCAEEEYRFDGLAEWCGDNREHYRLIWVGDLWERATFMRGMENILLDVALHASFMEELLREIANYVLTTMEILFARFEFECIGVSDDYGVQKALMMSPSDWRRLIRPRLAEIYDLAKRNGKQVFHHTCGNVSEIVTDMIDIGLDVLHPIQPEAMDIRALKREFGRVITLCGGVGTQNLLRTASVSDVREEVRQLKRDMGRYGGYILEPAITLQVDVPMENIIAMIEEARQGRR